MNLEGCIQTLYITHHTHCGHRNSEPSSCFSAQVNLNGWVSTGVENLTCFHRLNRIVSSSSRLTLENFRSLKDMKYSQIVLCLCCMWWYVIIFLMYFLDNTFQVFLVERITNSWLIFDLIYTIPCSSSRGSYLGLILHSFSCCFDLIQIASRETKDPTTFSPNSRWLWQFLFRIFQGISRSRPVYSKKTCAPWDFLSAKVPKYLPKVKGAMASLHESGFKSCGSTVCPVSAPATRQVIHQNAN